MNSQEAIASNEKLEPRNRLLKIRTFKELSILLLIVSLIIVISVTSPVFLTEANLMTLLIGVSSTAIVAIGMTIALISGGFDLSVGAVMGLSAVLTAVFANSGLNIWISALLALILCTLIGGVTGTFIGKVGLNPFITTLAVMQIARGLMFILTEGSSISLPSGTGSFLVLGQGTILGWLPIIVLIFIIMTILGDFLLKNSSSLMKVFYVGSNEKAAKLSGIHTGNVKIMVYMGTAALAAIAGILTVSRFGVATSSIGSGLEMTVISAAVIGGASLSGGKGTVLGSILGVLLLSIINNALVLYNISVHWQSLISGVILIVAILFDVLSNKRRA